MWYLSRNLGSETDLLTITHRRSAQKIYVAYLWHMVESMEQSVRIEITTLSYLFSHHNLGNHDTMPKERVIRLWL